MISFASVFILFENNNKRLLFVEELSPVARKLNFRTDSIHFFARTDLQIIFLSLHVFFAVSVDAVFVFLFCFLFFFTHNILSILMVIVSLFYSRGSNRWH